MSCIENGLTPCCIAFEILASRNRGSVDCSGTHIKVLEMDRMSIDVRLRTMHTYSLLDPLVEDDDPYVESRAQFGQFVGAPGRVCTHR
jgi:hypothetical protein